MEMASLIRNFGTIKKFQFLRAGSTNGITLRKQSALYGRYGPLCSSGRENHRKVSLVAPFDIRKSSTIVVFVWKTSPEVSFK